MPQPKPLPDFVMAATTYEGYAKELIHRLKFDRSRAGARDIARIMADRLQLPRDVVVTHAPTATSRIRARGYDQAALIAKYLAQFTGNHYIPLLSRLGQQRQLGRGRTARKEQLSEAFWVYLLDLYVNEQVLVIDDVFTTGATIQAATKALKEAGVSQVRAAVFATA